MPHSVPMEMPKHFSHALLIYFGCYILWFILNVCLPSQVMLRKKHIFNFRISNIGQTGLSYTWHYNKKTVEQTYFISVSPDEFIPSMCCLTSSLYVEPIKWGNLNNFKMVLQVIQFTLVLFSKTC